MSADSEQRTIVRDAVQRLRPYVPVESPEALAERLGMPLDMIVKLDSNENPYGCSVYVQEALGSFNRFQYYPDAQAQRLRERLGTYTGSDPERIVIGNGSDEIIDLLMLMLLERDDEVMIPTPTFGVYRARAELYGGRVVEIPRTESFDLDTDAMLDAMTTRTKMVIVCSPNNPTGNLASRSDIVRLLDTDAIVVVDEAYYEFCGKTILPLAREFDNLVILRTFSKWAGLAGLRLGYAVLPDQLVREFWKIKPPFNVNSAALLAAEASLDDLEFLHVSVNRIRNEARRLHRRLGSTNLLQPYPTVANFILCGVTRGDAQDIHLRLSDRGIMVRAYSDPLLRDYLRISVGRPEDTERLMTALQAIQASV